MKKLNLILIFIMVFLTACEKDKENVEVKNPWTPNEMNPLSGSTFVLSMDNAASTFQEFSWTEADFGFSAAITYIVQVDKKAKNFTTALDVVSVNNALKAKVTTGDFNKILLGAGLVPDEAADLIFRVKATINPTVYPIYSNVVEAKVAPYALYFPPIFMTGAATGGWGWDQFVYKELISTAPNVYQTTAHFLNGEAFRFFKQVGWGPTSYNYPYFTTVSNLFENANDGDSNLKFIGTTGYYKITVNMSTKTVAMESVAEPVLYMTGAALGGWDWTTNFVQLTWKSDGIFQATTDFANETFRFFKQAGWGDAYNYPYFADGTVSPLFENADDGDKNFRFIGTPGTFTITVNLNDLTVTMVAAP
jgi:hypothetical protein